jgi:hypothetical protein
VTRDRASPSLVTRSLRALHEGLDRSVPPEPCDAIVAFAGRTERARHALALWRDGAAPDLVLSVGRFEWRRFPELGLPSDGGLRDLVLRTPPSLRHFLVVIDRSGSRAEWMPQGRFGTLAESKAVARLARERGWRSVQAVTTAAHSRRALLALRRCTRGAPLLLGIVAVPEPQSSLRRDSWWRDGAGRALVLGEWMKLPVYGLLAR